MNFNQIMKQAQAMQKKLGKIEKEFDQKEVEFSSSNNLIKGVIDGKLKIKSLSIDEDLFDKENKEIMEDLLTITINEAVQKMSKDREDAINEATGGVGMAGLF